MASKGQPNWIRAHFSAEQELYNLMTWGGGGENNSIFALQNWPDLNYSNNTNNFEGKST